jgi:hypothetical protein
MYIKKKMLFQKNIRFILIHHEILKTVPIYKILKKKLCICK